MECDFCGYEDDYLTTCDYCGERFCSDCGDTSMSICHDCK